VNLALTLTLTLTLMQVIGPAPEDMLPKDATAGRLLTGSLNLAKLAGAAGSGDAPGAPAFSYLVRDALTPCRHWTAALSRIRDVANAHDE